MAPADPPNLTGVYEPEAHLPAQPTPDLDEAQAEAVIRAADAIESVLGPGWRVKIVRDDTR